MPWITIEQPSDRELNDFLRDRKKGIARFLVDESLGVEVANVLRSDGWNVRYIDDVGLAGHSDEDVCAFAFREGRLILTHDADFLDDRRFPPHRNPGVIVLPGGSGDEDALIRALGNALLIVGKYPDHYRRSKVAISTDGTITIRKRNIDTGAMENTKYRFTPGGLQIWEDPNDASMVNRTSGSRA